MLVFRNKIESLRLLRMSSPSCLAYYSGVMFCDDDQNTHRVQRIVALEFVVLTLDAFLQTGRHGDTTWYDGRRIK